VSRRSSFLIGIAGLALAIATVWATLFPAALQDEFSLVEGPMVQLAGETEVSLVWDGSIPLPCRLSVVVAERERTYQVIPEGTRYRVRLRGLSPGTVYSYRIDDEARTLFRGEFVTNKANGKAFRFLVFGDSGFGNSIQSELAKDMVAAAPDFVLHTGDLVYEDGERDGYRDRFFRPYGDLISRVSLWPSVGNHDVHEPGYGGAFLDVFELPENGPEYLTPEMNYWFDYGTARTVVVDSTRSREQQRMHTVPWLREVLSESGPRWRFVTLHHPPYSNDTQREMVRELLVPEFERFGVDVVFSGHDHLYTRSHPIRQGRVVGDDTGVVYVVTGAAADLAHPEKRRPPFLAVVDDTSYSFTVVDIQNDVLTLRQVSRGGGEIDRWKRVKRYGS
jgi:hypothetical protein